MYLIKIQTSAHNVELTEICVGSAKELFNALMILEGSERVKGFKVYDSTAGRVWDLYQAFGWGEFNKHAKEFNWNPV